MPRLLLLAAIILIALSSHAYAEFTIETDLKSIDFGPMNPGDTRGDIPSQGVTIRCTTTQGNSWQLRLHLETPLTHVTNPSSIITNDNFWWYGVSTTGSGSLVMHEQNLLTEQIAYTAPAGEGASGIDIKLKFKLTLPNSLQSGQYATKIILTMIE